MKRWALFAVFLGHLLDVCTSALPGCYEQNEWVRDAEHHAIIKHLLELKLVWVGLEGLLLLIAYKQIQKLSQLLADFVVVGVCLYGAYPYIELVIGNYVCYLGWINS
jgi:hypothetical protein